MIDYYLRNVTLYFGYFTYECKARGEDFAHIFLGHPEFLNALSVSNMQPEYEALKKAY